MIYTVKNGIFKHTLKDTSKKYVATKLFVDGWAVTDTIGNTIDSIRYNGKNEICSGTWNAEMIHEKTESWIRPPMVKELVIKTGSEEFHLFQDRNRKFKLIIDNNTYCIDGILSRTTTMQLPESFSALDAIRLFCFLQIAAHDDEVAIV